MKKLLNEVDDAVDQMIDGLVAAHSHRVRRGDNPRVVRRLVPKPEGHVALVIGNGSGHEPIAVGWVGSGLLDANACGDVFAAPPPDVLADAIVESDRGGGVVVLVSRHAGDEMAAELALEQARARGARCEPLLMYDDIATAPPERRHDRRGAPGTTFLYKVLGAAAEEGMAMDALLALGRRLRDQTATISLGVAAGVSPLTGRATHDVPAGQVVIGTGVHGEGGSGHRPMAPANELVADLCGQLLADLPFEPGDEVLVLVNGAGATTLMELLVVHRAVDSHLRAAGLVPFRPLVGEFVTTQDAAGISLSVARTDPEIRRLWTAPCDAPYFPPPGSPPVESTSP